MRPLWHFFILGSILGLALLAGLEIASPWAKRKPAPRIPTADQRSAALADGWIEGTDGYYRAIYGPDAY